MKKYILLTLAFAICALFVGCDKNNDNASLGDFDYDVELVFGTWYATEIDGEPWTRVRTIDTFYKDGRYYGEGYYGTGWGTYKLSGKTVTCYVGGEVYMAYTVTQLDETTFKAITHAPRDPAQTFTLTCKKEQ
jgi:hypothetical protein